MKNKLWPYSIILVFVLFGTFIISFVVRSMKTEVHLVRPDYYAHEINYQEHIRMESNGRTLLNAFRIEFDNKMNRLSIFIPDTIGVANGTINFYRPSDKKLDFKQDLSTYNKQTVNLSNLKKGLWQIEIQFGSQTGTNYYKEKQIFIE